MGLTTIGGTLVEGRQAFCDCQNLPIPEKIARSYGYLTGSANLEKANSRHAGTVLALNLQIRSNLVSRKAFSMRLLARQHLHICAIFIGHVVALHAAPAAEKTISFQRDIRPILADKCYTCHGPDEGKRAADLRLDDPQIALSERNGKAPVIRPGDPAASELIQRIRSDDPAAKMPPEDSGRGLSPGEIDRIELWIAQGATWDEHWSFAPIKRPAIAELSPQFENTTSGAIDRLVQARLKAEGLMPSGVADRATLLRRVYLDLVGLPPGPDELDAFCRNDDPQAYARVVDRLLASPRYGEHMAVAWLDAARYADTSGYQNDGPRDMWRWRDWVIDAFNQNMPFDQFTIEQIAGDLLENASQSQIVATGFNRNHRGNAEGGIIPEEYQVEYVVDRVDTTFGVWLGLTMGCARCHDHKYDPITQREYYQVFAYFNNIPESGRAIKEGNSPPWIKAPREDESLRLKELDDQIAQCDRELDALGPHLAVTQADWERTFRPASTIDWTIDDGLISHHPFDRSLEDIGQQTKSKMVGEPAFAAGIHDGSLVLSGAGAIDAGDVAQFGYFDRFSVCLWVKLNGADGTLVSRMTPVEEGSGWSLQLREGRLQVNLIKRWLDDAIRVESVDSLQLNRWYHVAAVYDGSRVASGIQVYVDGNPVRLAVHLDRLNQSFGLSNEPLRIGGGASNLRAQLDEVRIYNRDLEGAEIGLLAESSPIDEILKLQLTDRTPAQLHKLRRYFIENYADQSISALDRRRTNLRRERRDYYEKLPSVMVMEEMKQPRPTHVLVRGQYDQPADRVQPNVPRSLAPILTEEKHPRTNNRLELARWLVNPQQPLTPRVIMNRIWQHHFGNGLVRTSEDFGAQGDLPSHPELLDWLAMEFVDSGWDIKAMQRSIVLSHTYRQSSAWSIEAASQDPDNRLLARGPRYRLPAEVVRDQMLAACGLLGNEIGGPSVKPYQPDGLWQEIATDTQYEQSHGADLYRRSLYTYWKRTVAPPTMVTLDAAGREACVVQRSKTNTPLQALALMNDKTFVEASRVLAQRAIEQQPTHHRIESVFRILTCRNANAEELAILNRRYDRWIQHFSAEPEAAKRLCGVGEFPVPSTIDVRELAALATLTSLIANLDEVQNQQ